MWTIVSYPWRGYTGSPEKLYTAKAVVLDNGLYWQDNDDQSYSKTDYLDYDIDLINKIIKLYKKECPKSIENNEISWE